MSMQIESAKNLQEFVNFANYKRDDGDAIAQFSPASGSTLRQITATDQDHLRGIFNWKYHGEENAAANNQIRQHFILNVLKCLGCTGLPEDHALTQTEIKAAVNTILAGPENKTRRTALLDALKVGDYGRGRPLTSRRIGATLSQVKAVLEDRVARGGDDWSCAPGGKVVVSENIRILSSLEPEKSGLHSNPVDPAFELAIIETMSGFLRDLTLGHNAEIFNRNGIPHDDKIQICEGLSNDRDCLKLILKGDLKEVVGIVKKQWGPNVGEDALRRFLTDILKTYNRQQRFYKLRVVIPEEEIKNSNPPPSERNQITLEEPNELKGESEKEHEMPAQGDISGQKNVSNEKGQDPDPLIMAKRTERVKNSDQQDYTLHFQIRSKINNFLRGLMDGNNEGILKNNKISLQEFKEICMSLYVLMSDLSYDVFEDNLKIVADILKNRYGLEVNVDDGVLNRVLLDILKAYNEQQEDVNLRVVIPEED